MHAHADGGKQILHTDIMGLSPCRYVLLGRSKPPSVLSVTLTMRDKQASDGWLQTLGYRLETRLPASSSPCSKLLARTPTCLAVCLSSCSELPLRIRIARTYSARCTGQRRLSDPTPLESPGENWDTPASQGLKRV